LGLTLVGGGAEGGNGAEPGLLKMNIVIRFGTDAHHSIFVIV